MGTRLTIQYLPVCLLKAYLSRQVLPFNVKLWLLVVPFNIQLDVAYGLLLSPTNLRSDLSTKSYNLVFWLAMKAYGLFTLDLVLQFKVRLNNRELMALLVQLKSYNSIIRLGSSSSFFLLYLERTAAVPESKNTRHTHIWLLTCINNIF